MLAPGTQGDYINAVCRLDTALDAHDLLSHLQVIEARTGTRSAKSAGPLAPWTWTCCFTAS